MKEAKLIDGRSLAQLKRQSLKLKVQQIVNLTGVSPSLHVLLIGNNLASQIYVSNKQKACAEVGILCQIHQFDEGTDPLRLKGLIQTLNADQSVHGILLQLPLPSSFVAQSLLEEISPLKDVDGLHPYNLGKLIMGIPSLIPCTPQGCLELIRSLTHDLAGKVAVVVGRSVLVGKAVSALLTNANATVILAHSATKDLVSLCQQADILIAAIGKPNFFTADFIKPGAIVIDVGINRTFNSNGGAKLVGDVDQASVIKVAGYLSPVPGGVGPMTISYLLSNTIQAMITQNKDSQNKDLYDALSSL